ncbi:thiamine diphosphate-binding protein [Mucidula mucida]|nr:thiamine diphosphate-binding protein [Mucidula mucida]
MAEGYARASGKPGVVLVTSRPGAKNVITAMQDTLSDGGSLVMFTGQVATSVIGSDAFQEADHIGISRSCTRWNVMIKDISELPRRINEAFKIATSGRPGPVLVDLPKDVTAGILKTPLPFSATTPDVNLGLLSNPLQMFEVPADTPPAHPPSRRSDKSSQKANHLCRAWHSLLFPRSPAPPPGNIPVTTTLYGLGSFDETNPLSMHGSAYANIAIQKADVIIALGGRFDDRVTCKVDTFAPAAKAVFTHMDDES